MLRSLLLKAAAKAKGTRWTDGPIRYNPLVRHFVFQELKKYEKMARDGNGDPGSFLDERILKAATHSLYGNGRTLSLKDWPILHKEQIKDNPHHFLNPKAAVKLPAGTGGTGGIPLRLWRSAECVVAEQIFLDELLKPHGLTMQSRMAVLRGDSVKPQDDLEPPYGRLTHQGNRLTFSSAHLNRKTLPWYHDALKSFKPDILWIYPNAAVNLMKLLEEANLSITIPLIFASSEMLPEAQHRALEDQFKSAVINYYGQAERVCFASSTKPGEFYFNPRYGRAEFGESTLSDNGEEHIVPLIGTGYWNRTMPLIRYHTGDLIYLPKNYGPWEMQEVAMGRLPFTGLVGRQSEYLVTGDGMRIIGLNQIPRELEKASQIQLVQTDPETLRIDVLPLHGFSEEDEAKLHAQARAKLPSSIHITIRKVDDLQKTLSGKAPFVIRLFEE